MGPGHLARKYCRGRGRGSRLINTVLRHKQCRSTHRASLAIFVEQTKLKRGQLCAQPKLHHLIRCRVSAFSAFHRVIHQMFRNQYDNDITTWSPQGRIHQVEYAMEAVKQGSATVGAKNKTHAVLVALKRYAYCVFTRSPFVVAKVLLVVLCLSASDTVLLPQFSVNVQPTAALLLLCCTIAVSPTQDATS